MNLAGSICVRGLTKKNPIGEGCVGKWTLYCLALRRSNSIATASLLFRPTVWWWSPQQQTSKFKSDTRFISSHLPAFGITTTRSISMGSGGSKVKDKKGRASEEGKQQQQQEQAGEQQAQGKAENPVYNEGTSEQQPRQQETQVEQTSTAAAESEATMAEEYVEAVVAKASDFGDNE
jgi:hypothetical protein